MNDQTSMTKVRRFVCAVWANCELHYIWTKMLKMRDKTTKRRGRCSRSMRIFRGHCFPAGKGEAYSVVK